MQKLKHVLSSYGTGRSTTVVTICGVPVNVVQFPRSIIIIVV